MKDIYILGISAFYHDSAASLIKNGEIIAAAQEERFTRKKGDSSFPLNAVKYCLKAAKIKIDKIDHIVFYDKPILTFDRLLASYIHTVPKGLLSFVKAIPLWLRSKLWTEDVIKKELELKKEKDILFTEHHQSHAASAFFPSPFKEAAILTIDGVGEWTTTAISIGRGNKLDLLKKIEFPHSLGLLYSAFTYYCGFRVNSGEYKLMGLAPYGKPRYLDLIKKNLININKDGSYLLNQKYFKYSYGLKMITHRFEKLFGKKALKQGLPPTPFFMDIAASIQALFNEILVSIAKYAREVTGMDNLCLAGGVALNCVANKEILDKSGFKDVWIQPASGDAGGSLGAALYVYYSYLDKDRKIKKRFDSQKGSYLGPEYTDAEIENLLKKSGATYKKFTEKKLIETTADLLKKEKVVGWFQGRMEFGPRALGNRSILGDPRSIDMQSTMNLKIKFRESFRPFAPSVIEEAAVKYFDITRPAPYMTLIAPVRKNKLVKSSSQGKKTGLDLLKIKRSVIQAVTHVDNTARLQTVSKKSNPLFYKLIKEFEKKTKCPVLINTSFNVRGEPIVESPLDAYSCFMGTDMDVLVIGSYFLYKQEQPAGFDLIKWKKSLIKD